MNEVYCTISDFIDSIIGSRNGVPTCRNICLSSICVRECSPVWADKRAETVLQAVMLALLKVSEYSVVEINDSINVYTDISAPQYAYFIAYFVSQVKGLKSIYINGNEVICRRRFQA